METTRQGPVARQIITYRDVGVDNGSADSRSEGRKEGELLTWILGQLT
jgi:hypothetical protein